MKKIFIPMPLKSGKTKTNLGKAFVAGEGFVITDTKGMALEDYQTVVMRKTTIRRGSNNRRKMKGLPMLRGVINKSFKENEQRYKV